MSVILHLPFEQLKEMVKQLSPAEVEELKAELEASGQQKKESTRSKLQELLRQGPVMSEAQLNEIERTRERISCNLPSK